MNEFTYHGHRSRSWCFFRGLKRYTTEIIDSKHVKYYTENRTEQNKFYLPNELTDNNEKQKI